MARGEPAQARSAFVTMPLRIIDRCSEAVARLGELAAVVLMISTCYEVVARYVFNAPTIWSNDLSYMCAGAIFLLGAGQTLRENAHVRIDFISQSLPPRLSRMLDGLLFLLAVFPVVAALATVAARRAMRAYTTGEVEVVSPWAPLMWPFLGVIALGLAILALQVLAHGLRCLLDRRKDVGPVLERS
jgi:TRAP-type mannitol/chloroaromatic compound transport system permease small subunit